MRPPSRSAGSIGPAVSAGCAADAATLTADRGGVQRSRWTVACVTISTVTVPQSVGPSPHSG
jgi:hypothetical protein